MNQLIVIYMYMKYLLFTEDDDEIAIELIVDLDDVLYFTIKILIIISVHTHNYIRTCLWTYVHTVQMHTKQHTHGYSIQ